MGLLLLFRASSQSSGMSYVGMQKILDTLTGVSAYGIPTLYAALTTTTPTQNVAGTAITTGQYGGYARVALTGSLWSTASAGASTYGGTIDFGSASSSTGTSVAGVELWDASSGGNRIWWWDAPSSVSVSTGTHLELVSNALSVSIPVLSAGAGFSTFYANKMVEHMVGKTAFGSAPVLWVSLCSTAATSSSMGTEIVYTGYTQKKYLSSNLNAASSGSPSVRCDVVSNVDLLFPSDTGGTQTNPGYVSITDSPGGGNLIGGMVISGTVVSVGNSPNIPSGSPIFTLF